MKHLFSLALLIAACSACTSDRKSALEGSWKLSSVETVPAGGESEQPATGTIYTFRADSTVSIAGKPGAWRYEILRQPEGLFLDLKGTPPMRYRIAAMTPSELRLFMQQGRQQISMTLEYQR